MADKSPARCTEIDLPLHPGHPVPNPLAYRRYRWSKHYSVTLRGAFIGEVHNAKHSGSYGTTYWWAIEHPDAPPGNGRGVTEHPTRREAVAHLVARYTAAQAAAPEAA